jgi:hypothetical protein
VSVLSCLQLMSANTLFRFRCLIYCSLNLVSLYFYLFILRMLLEYNALG